MQKFRYIIQEIRITHWIKNLLLFGPLLFAKLFLNVEFLGKTILGFLSFSFAASSIYIINDIIDRKFDKNHPKKKTRPIASGNISIPEANFLIIALLALAISIALYINPKFLAVLPVYVFLNLVYSLKFKHVAIFDIIFISLMYVLRVYAGAAVINVPVSEWILLTTFFLALFLILAKRRSEYIRNYEMEFKDNSRQVLTLYNRDILNFLLVSSFSITITFYAFYAMTKSSLFIWSILMVIFVLMRYLYLIFVEDKGEEPVELVIKDKQIFFGMCIWVLYILFILYF